jgi:phenylacetic acid degradation operon negative regulatory protein
MNDPIRERIEAFGRQKRVHANSLIISLFGDSVVPRGGRIWLGSLIRLLEPLGLNARLIRTSVFRLAKDEWLRTEALGRRSDYLLTPSGQRRFDEASRHIYASQAPIWDRRWRLILNIKPMAPKDREKLRRALFWHGFGAVGVMSARGAPGSANLECFIHPSADLSMALDALVTEGLGHLLDGLAPLLATDSHPGGTASNADLVAHAWNLDELAADYAGFVATYMPSLTAMQRQRRKAVGDEDAFLMRLLLIHDFRRLLLRDPELPEQLVPAHWPGQTARVLCRDLYRRLLDASERHLDRWFQTADGRCPAALCTVRERFPEHGLLPAIAR